ncbi:hypothetical protein ACQCVP_09260 [Rossellomorea vietnamensis]|uniref:hypothetical protein n=1 Tax=Rossellomorea vietnamensis TaxID=218284 RepID=UPI003CF66747
MYSPALLGYMSGAKKGDICIHKTRVGTYVEEKGVVHVPTPPLGYMSEVKKGDICIHKTRVDT